MRETEELALEDFRMDGWSPMRNGWPDYLLVRSNGQGELEFMGLEVKCDGQDLTDEQRAMHVALLAAGIKVIVKKVDPPRPRNGNA